MDARPASPAPTPLPAAPTPEPAPYSLRLPDPARASPLIFASPHSGRLYPMDMMDASVLDAAAIRKSEDAFVDDLIADGPSHGATLIAAVYARAYIDVNREPYELDAGMFEDELPPHARVRTARAAAGLGSIARIVAEGQEIYGRKLTFAEADRRIEGVHAPYHAALAGMLDETQARFGRAVLIDWHSMPSAAARTLGQSGDPVGAGNCDLVLGDRFGEACAPDLTALVERTFEGLGYRVARNAPYAGGYTTQRYGRPAAGVQALQIEINRALYLNEATLEPHGGFARLKRDLEAVFKVLRDKVAA